MESEALEGPSPIAATVTANEQAAKPDTSIESTASNAPVASPEIQCSPQPDLQSGNPVPGRAYTDVNLSSSRRKRMLNSIRAALTPTHHTYKESKWEQTILVKIKVGGREQTATAVTKFDPHCPVDAASTRFLETNFENLKYDSWAGKTIGYSVTGKEPYQSIGKIDMNWYGQKRPSRFSRFLNRGPEPQFQSRFEKSTFQVVESERFELIIGRATIDKLEMYKQNNEIIATWISAPDDTKAADISKDQQASTTRREEERKSIEERRKKIKEQKKLDKK